MLKTKMLTAPIPMRIVGPMKIVSDELNEDVSVPLATFEKPLWYTVNRGARVSTLSGGIQAVVIHESMTRSILVQGPSAHMTHQLSQELHRRHTEIAALVTATSQHAKLKECHYQQVGNLLYIRLAITSGDAAGHNMVTKAADAILSWVLQQYSYLRYISISANICTDKKVSAINSLFGRGKYVTAELVIPRPVCQQKLRTTPEQLVELHIKKNLLGSILAGSIQSANAHFANMLLAIYLATGQDAANIVEGSQGIVHAEVINENLYFSVTLPNIIVGTVGNGKNLEFVQENLKLLGCLEDKESGHNARRLAIIVACTVLCGELSLLAAQTNPGDLMRSHIKLERFT